MTHWQKYLVAAFFIIFGVWLFITAEKIKSHNHDKQYTTHEDVGDHMRWLRNDIRFYIDREEELKEILKRLGHIELEESR